jgi:hypothetical protein
MSKPADESCSVCMYYVTGVGVWADVYACHRYPPLPWGTKGSKKADEVLWPATYPDAWCGEFRKAAVPNPQYDLGKAVEVAGPPGASRV